MTLADLAAIVETSGSGIEFDTLLDLEAFEKRDPVGASALFMEVAKVLEAGVEIDFETVLRGTLARRYAEQRGWTVRWEFDGAENRAFRSGRCRVQDGPRFRWESGWETFNTPAGPAQDRAVRAQTECETLIPAVGLLRLDEEYDRVIRGFE